MGPNSKKPAGGLRSLRSISSNGKTYVYLFTLKNNSKKYTSLKELMETYRETIDKGTGIEWHTSHAIELDSDDRLHLHTCLTTPKKLLFSKFQKKGWSVHFKEFDDYDNAKGYINKYTEKQCPAKWQQLDDTSYYRHHYGFI